MQESQESQIPLSRHIAGLEADGRLGIPASASQPLLQQDAFKELVNKFAWVLGSTYRVPYNNVRTPARQFAIVLAQHTQRKHGYPAQLGYPKA